jgi:hypothetical protein
MRFAAFQICILTVAIALAMPAAEAGAKPAYVGLWASYPKQCKKPHDGSDSAIRLQVGAYDQFEQHCAFGPVARRGGSWHARATCLSVGEVDSIDKITIWATSQRLTLKWASEKHRLHYVRCR